MIRGFSLAAALALASCGLTPALAGHATASDAPAGFAPEMASVTVAATSTPLTATITSSAATLAAGASQLGGVTASCSFASNTAKCGPFVPQLGRPVRVVTQQASAFTGSWYLGTSTNGCTTVNRLTSLDSTSPDFTGQVNDFIDIPPSSGGVAYCIVAAITGGTLDLAVRQ